jgi:hypothetical protein
MALDSYSALKTTLAGFLHADDLDSVIPDFITLAEARIQADAKLLEFETTATVTITAGVGTLPTGFVGMRSVYWDSDPDYPLSYVAPEMYDAMRGNDSGDGRYYTITGSSIKTTPMGDGSVVCTYSARFTPLSDSNTTNAILTNFPDVYLYGSLMQAAIYTKDEADMQKYGLLFNAAMDRLNQNNQDRKYAGSTLQVRTR